jgi:glycosyltransferase involved in cell wall biosynthesis
MKLLIVSNMAHYKADGKIVGWGPTVQEIDHIASKFEEVRHLACLHPEPPPRSSLAYSSKNVRLIPLPPAGGEKWKDKLGILRLSPLYLRTILKELHLSEAIHIRCPANIPLLAIILLTLFRIPYWRWVKYAGNWQPDGREPWSYTFQRWWLQRGFHRGVVTVNGRWPGQPQHVYSFLNPSLTARELELARAAGGLKDLTFPLKLLFVGRVEAAKGAGRVLLVADELRQRGIPFEIDFVGDAPERSTFEDWARARGLDPWVTFHGWQSKQTLADFYARAHFLIFPSASEGWPKVLSEAMAYGVVPLAGAVSSIPQILAETGAGLAIPPMDISGFVKALEDYAASSDLWKLASRAGMAAAGKFTYEHYLQQLNRMFQDAWGITLPMTENRQAQAKELLDCPAQWLIL